MPYTTVVVGTTIMASWANTNVRDQVITPFASSAARSSAISSPIEGMMSVLTDGNRADIYNASSWSSLVNPAYGAWNTYAGAAGNYVQQNGAAVAGSAAFCQYIRIGRLCIYFLKFLVSSGATTGFVEIYAPFTASGTGVLCGTGFIYDASATANYSGFAYIKETNTDLIDIRSGSSTATDNRLGVVTFTAALTTSDIVQALTVYETDADA